MSRQVAAMVLPHARTYDQWRVQGRKYDELYAPCSLAAADEQLLKDEKRKYAAISFLVRSVRADVEAKPVTRSLKFKRSQMGRLVQK